MKLSEIDKLSPRHHEYVRLHIDHEQTLVDQGHLSREKVEKEYGTTESDLERYRNEHKPLAPESQSATGEQNPLELFEKIRPDHLLDLQDAYTKQYERALGDHGASRIGKIYELEGGYVDKQSKAIRQELVSKYFRQELGQNNPEVEEEVVKLLGLRPWMLQSIVDKMSSKDEEPPRSVPAPTPEPQPLAEPAETGTEAAAPVPGSTQPPTPPAERPAPPAQDQPSPLETSPPSAAPASSTETLQPPTLTKRLISNRWTFWRPRRWEYVDSGNKVVRIEEDENRPEGTILGAAAIALSALALVIALNKSDKNGTSVSESRVTAIERTIHNHYQANLGRDEADETRDAAMQKKIDTLEDQIERTKKDLADHKAEREIHDVEEPDKADDGGADNDSDDADNSATGTKEHTEVFNKRDGDRIVQSILPGNLSQDRVGQYERIVDINTNQTIVGHVTYAGNGRYSLDTIRSLRKAGYRVMSHPIEIYDTEGIGPRGDITHKVSRVIRVK